MKFAHWTRDSFDTDKAKTKKLRKLLEEHASKIGGWEKEDGRFYIWLSSESGYTFDMGAMQVSSETETGLVQNFMAELTEREELI